MPDKTVTDEEIIGFLARKGYIGGRELQKLATLHANNQAAQIKAEGEKIKAEAARVKSVNDLELSRLKTEEQRLFTEAAQLKAAERQALFNLKQTEKALKRSDALVTLEEVAIYIGVAPITVRAYSENKRRALQYGVTELRRIGKC